MHALCVAICAAHASLCVCSLPGPLPQLDAGVLERIMLLSRDESSMLVASYADLKRCLESAYADLQAQAQAATARSRAAAMGAGM